MFSLEPSLHSLPSVRSKNSTRALQGRPTPSLLFQNERNSSVSVKIIGHSYALTNPSRGSIQLPTDSMHLYERNHPPYRRNRVHRPGGCPPLPPCRLPRPRAPSAG